MTKIKLEMNNNNNKNNNNNNNNNAIRTNNAKVKTQQNSKFRLCGDRDETINRTINEYSKLAQKEY